MKIKNIIKACIFSTAAFIMASCSVDDEIKSLVYDREFSPVDFKAEVDNDTVKFTWTSPKPAESYVMEIYSNEVFEGEPDTVLTTNIIDTLKVKGLEHNISYLARMKAVSKDKKESKWTELTQPFEIKQKEAPAPKPVTHNITFEEFAAGSAPASWGDGKFVITPTDPNGKMVADANSCYFYEKGGSEFVHFTSRLKSGGKSSATANYLTLTIPGDGKLYIYVRTGSNGDTTRDIIVTQNDEVLKDYTLVEADMKTEGVEVPGEPNPVSVYTPVEVDVKKGIAVITYPVNGVNFYGFTLISLDEEGAGEPEEPQGPTGEDGVITFEAGAEVADGAEFVFGSAKIVINNGGGKFAIDANSQYFGDASSQTRYTARMKTGAKSADANGVALTLDVEGTVVIAMRSSSSSADRAVSLVDATGATVASWTVGDSNATKDVAIEGEAEPKTVFNYYTVNLRAGTYNFTYDGGLNFYSLQYMPLTVHAW